MVRGTVAEASSGVGPDRLDPCGPVEQPRTAGAPKYGLGSEERRDRDSASNPFASLPAHIQEEIHVPNSVVGTDSAEDRLDTVSIRSLMNNL